MTAAAPARRIEEFVSTTPGTGTPQPEYEAPTFVGHLLEMPLTNGEEALVDPDEIVSVSAHRHEQNVTVIRQKGDNYTYFINRHYSTVKRWVKRSLDS
jgi:hypothetical protein